MTYGEYLGAWSAVTKWLYHLNSNPDDSSWNASNWTRTWTPTYVDWMFWQGASFNWSARRINLPSNLWWNWGSWWTASLWMKVTSNPWYNTFSELFRLVENATKSAFVIGYFNNGWTIQVSWWRSRINVESECVVNRDLNDWKIYNIVATYTWTTNTVYLNWVSIGTSTSSWNWIGTHTSEGIINRNNLFNWWMDEVIAESKAWTATEVQKYYTMAKGRFGIT